MLRVVERVMGEGNLLRAGLVVLRAGYEITLYRHWEMQDGALQPGAYDVEGFLVADPTSLEPALGVATPLTLHLDDGRRCDVYVVNTDGVITSADRRGLYTVDATGLD